jgi:hypothetical protein
MTLVVAVGAKLLDPGTDGDVNAGPSTGTDGDVNTGFTPKLNIPSM